MIEPANPLVDLNDALGKALLAQFFEPIPIGRDLQTGGVITTTAPIALLAQEMFKAHSASILNDLWTKIDRDVLTEQIATSLAKSVVAAYTETPTYYRTQQPEQKALHARVLEIVAQQLGQRVIDQMDVQLSSKPAIEQEI